MACLMSYQVNSCATLMKVVPWDPPVNPGGRHAVLLISAHRTEWRLEAAMDRKSGIL